MKNILYLLVFTLLACQDEPSCEKTDDESTGLITRVLSYQVAYDQQTGDLGANGIRISTNDDYQRVFAHCCAGKLEHVDFTQSDILGQSTVNQGCSSSYWRDVQRDDAARRLVYTVTERFCKKCSPVEGQGNFVVVPKIPEGYTVTYVRRQ